MAGAVARRALARRAVIVGVAAAVIVPLVQATPAAAATNGLISYRQGNTIFSANENGSNPLALATDAKFDSTWAPDGSRFAYTSLAGPLKTRRADGTGEVLLTPNNSGPSGVSWTPDGVFVIYSGNGKLHYVAVDGGWARGPVFPIEHPWLDDYPTVAPDNTVVFDRNSGPSGARQLYRYALGDVEPTLLLANGMQPSFSPDGTKLAYTNEVSGVVQIWIANADGSNPAALTNEPAGAFGAAWSPDGLSILATSAGSVKRFPAAGGAGTTVVNSGTEPSWQPVARNKVQRVWGPGHLETAVQASQYNYETKAAPDGRATANSVVLSRDDTFLDALVGSALAISQQGPLLVTPRAALDSRIETEINRILNRSGTVYLLGGELALAPAVANRLTALGYTPVRIWGQNHYETAIKINNEMVDPEVEKPTYAIVTTGANFFDALAAGAASGANRGTVIVLTNGDQIPAESLNYLRTLTPSADPGTGTVIVTAGGPGDRALTNARQAGQLPSWPGTYTPDRLVGPNHRDTAVAIANYFFGAPGTAAVATDTGWLDALTGGAMIGFNYGPLLLTQPASLDPGVQQYLSRNSGNVWSGVMLGGTAALPPALQAPIGNAISLPTQWDYQENPRPAASASPAAADPLPPPAGPADRDLRNPSTHTPASR